MAWRSAMGWPKVTRCLEKSTAICSRRSAVPTQREAMIHLPWPIHCIPSLNPPPTSHSTCSSGPRTSSKKSSAGDHPPIVGTGREVQPIERSTRKHVTPPSCGGLLRSVTAKTIVKSASLPPVINTFCPLMTQYLPSLTALVRMLVGSEPPPVSVHPKHHL